MRLASFVAICIALPAAASAGTGEVRCWIDRGAVVVPAAYGPIAGDFVLDLSQVTSRLHITAAQTAGWTQGPAQWTLRLAGQSKRGFPMTVADLDALTASFPTNIAGILGADVLAGFAIDLDLKPCRLRLTRERLRHDVRSRTRMFAGIPTVFAGISDGVTTRIGWFAVDTASAASRIAEAHFSRSPSVGADAGGRLRAVSVNEVLVEQTPAGIMSLAAPGLAGSLGTSIWTRVHLHVDGRALSAQP